MVLLKIQFVLFECTLPRGNKTENVSKHVLDSHYNEPKCDITS